jgi:ribosomal-protein-alanine N-acetyltransferase
MGDRTMKNYVYLMSKSVLMVALVLAVFVNLQAAELVIERYQPSRDGDAVIKILNDYPAYLRYESAGYASGTTEKYLNSAKYSTDVLRVDGKTIGFINYIAQDITLLTFNFGRMGLIHLMGVDKEYQRKGYGRILFQHVVERLKELNTPTIMLATKRENSAAIALYEKEGFLCALSPHARATAKDLFFMLSVEVPADKLPKGNIIQRNPKAFFTLAVVAVCGFMYKKFIAS